MQTKSFYCDIYSHNLILFRHSRPKCSAVLKKKRNQKRKEIEKKLLSIYGKWEWKATILCGHDASLNVSLPFSNDMWKIQCGIFRLNWFKKFLFCLYKIYIRVYMRVRPPVQIQCWLPNVVIWNRIFLMVSKVLKKIERQYA